MNISVFNTPEALGTAAGATAAKLIGEAINTNGTANIILATGTSQFETLNSLVLANDIDWNKVIMFHLDEYISLPVTHMASFRKYLQERFLSKVGPLKEAFLINGNTDPVKECERLSTLIRQHPVDVALIGIGENGHLAFNDPPADFETSDPYIIVELDEACKKQQMGEGWFHTIDEVPLRAISMSVQQILKSKNIICSVPGERKAAAIRNTFEKEISNMYPSSILRTQPSCNIYLDTNSASMLSGEIKETMVCRND